MSFLSQVSHFWWCHFKHRLAYCSKKKGNTIFFSAWVWQLYATRLAAWWAQPFGLLWKRWIPYIFFSSQHCQCCSGPDTENPDNININDVLGDFSLTLIDSLDTLAGIIYLDVKCRLYCVICSILVMGNASEFRRAVRLVVDTVHFDKSNTVQVCMFSLILVFKWMLMLMSPGFWSKHKTAWEPSLCSPFDGGSQFSRAGTWLVPGGLTQV